MAFSADCLKAVLAAYPPIVDKHKDDDFTEQQKQWQLMRRGRCAWSMHFECWCGYDSIVPAAVLSAQAVLPIKSDPFWSLFFFAVEFWCCPSFCVIWRC